MNGMPAVGDLLVVPSGPVRGEIAAPGSKSVTIRALAIAAMADGTSLVRAPLRSDDTAAMLGAVASLGCAVAEEDGNESGTTAWRVAGVGGAPWPSTGVVDCRLSGATLRLVTALATNAAAPTKVTGAPPLLARPVGPLTRALAALGAELSDTDGRPPVHLRGGGLAGGEVTVDVSASSQFASAVLMAAPLARRPVDVRLQGDAAVAYIDLTVQALRSAGVDIDADGAGRRWRVVPGPPGASDVTVEYDASAACHLFALAAATGGAVTVTNVTPTTQPDSALVDVLQQMGAAVTADGSRLTVTGPERLHPVDVDLSAMPDQVTTVAALAALADGTSHLRGVGVTRGHETDRLAALATELGHLGVCVREDPDALHIDGIGSRGGARPDTPVRLDTHDDHRLAMAFAAVGAAVDGVVVGDAGCVAKTYPGFWSDAAALGLRWRSAADPEAPSRPWSR